DGRNRQTPRARGARTSLRRPPPARARLRTDDDQPRTRARKTPNHGAGSKGTSPGTVVLEPFRGNRALVMKSPSVRRISMGQSAIKDYYFICLITIVSPLSLPAFVANFSLLKRARPAPLGTSTEA